MAKSFVVEGDVMYIGMVGFYDNEKDAVRRAEQLRAIGAKSIKINGESYGESHERQETEG